MYFCGVSHNLMFIAPNNHVGPHLPFPLQASVHGMIWTGGRGLEVFWYKAAPRNALKCREIEDFSPHFNTDNWD